MGLSRIRTAHLFASGETLSTLRTVKVDTMATAELDKMTTAELQEHLYSLEERLLHPDRETDRNSLLDLITPEFKEFCTSGRVFNANQLGNELLNSAARPATITYFYVTPLGENSALATYQITTSNSTSRHSSIWVRRNGQWQMYFHQGTISA